MSTSMPSRKRHTTVATLVLDVLETIEQVRYATDQENATDHEGPGAVGKTGQLVIL